MAKITDTFSKHYGDPRFGYTMEEAIAKRTKVDEAHHTGSRDSKWEKAKIVPDPSRKEGYMVTISTKE